MNLPLPAGNALVLCPANSWRRDLSEPRGEVIRCTEIVKLGSNSIQLFPDDVMNVGVKDSFALPSSSLT